MAFLHLLRQGTSSLCTLFPFSLDGGCLENRRGRGIHTSPLPPQSPLPAPHCGEGRGEARRRVRQNATSSGGWGEAKRKGQVPGRAGTAGGWVRSALSGLLFLLACLALGCGAGPLGGGAGRVGGSDNLQIKGSDTLVNLALAWAETYMQIYPEVGISVSGGGSGTGIAALINGTVDVANASRAMKAEEIAAAEANGIVPVEFVVAYDAIAVVVHPSNPVDGLTMQQISDIYAGRITHWSQVGGEDCPIVLLSRESNSGTYVYFLEEVIRLGQDSDLLLSPEALLMPSSEGISAEVRQNPNAIGYDGLGYVTPDQKVLAVAQQAGGPFVLPAVETVKDGSYPIARELYMYTAGEPEGLLRDYLDWILDEGQVLVIELGFVPLR
ncbi:MAG: phosphate ABC transporter substrate-binding protein [Chloroflexia bacterium]|nr:phosphate ABC transporter substrate-binding protein [Chloroflexia bacterium]